MVILILGAVIYGGWNARNPVVNEYEVTVNKEAGSRKELRIAMVSDIHFGPVIDAGRLEPLLERMEELKPDSSFWPGTSRTVASRRERAGSWRRFWEKSKRPWASSPSPETTTGTSGTMRAN